MNCSQCIYFETFDPRTDEPSTMGCTLSPWAGYISDIYCPPCGGIGFVKKAWDSPHWDWRLNYCNKHRRPSLPCPLCLIDKDPSVFMVRDYDESKPSSPDSPHSSINS